MPCCVKDKPFSLDFYPLVDCLLFFQLSFFSVSVCVLAIPKRISKSSRCKNITMNANERDESVEIDTFGVQSRALHRLSVWCHH